MLNHISSFVLSLFLLAHAAPANPNLKWDLEVRDQSRKFHKEMYPKGPVDAWWASPAYNRKSGLLRTDVPGAYRHMHAMVVAAFYAKRKDHREAARSWLKSYECENVVACEDFHQFYDGALKANALTIKDDKALAAAQALRDSILERARKLAERKPPTTGVCAPQADRAGWLALEYELFCPAKGTPRQHGLCPSCAETKALELQLNMDSHQMVMSSSFLDTFEHRGIADCSKPWKVWIKCGGGVTAAYSLECERKAGQVSCREK